MKKFFPAITVMCLAWINMAFAQTTYSLKDFDRVNVQGNIELRLVSAGVESVVVADGADKVSVETEGRTLRIKMNFREQVKGEKVKVDVNYKRLKELKAGGGASVVANFQGTEADFSAHVNSGASLWLEGDFSSLELNAGTGGKIEVRGTAGYLEAEAKTTSEIRARRLEVEKALLKAYTGGILEATVKRSVEASVSTAGELILIGTPQEEKISTSAGGKLTRIRK